MKSNKQLFSVLIWIAVIGSFVSLTATIYDLATAVNPMSKSILIVIIASNLSTLGVCSYLITKKRPE